MLLNSLLADLLLSVICSLICFFYISYQINCADKRFLRRFISALASLLAAQRSQPLFSRRLDTFSIPFVRASDPACPLPSPEGQVAGQALNAKTHQ